MQTRRTCLAVLSAMALTVTACSGSGSGTDPQVASLATDDPDAAETASESVDPDEAFLAFAECMRDHDVPFEDPEAGGGAVTRSQTSDGEASVTIDGVEVDPDVFEAAQEACDPLLEDVVANRDMDPAEIAEMQDRMFEFGECMRDHGIDWEDPVIAADGGRITMRGGDGTDGEPGGGAGGNADLMDDPEAQDALDECNDIIGETGPHPGNVPAVSDVQEAGEDA